MKQKYMIATLVLSSLFLVNILGSINASASGLQVTFTTNPIIIGPGTNGYLSVNLKSIGSSVSNIALSASSWDPQTVIPQGNWEVDVGSLDSGESYSVLYEFKVASAATPGLYQVVFEIESSAGDSRQTAMIQVDDTTILDIASITPSEISIGQATTLLFNITNRGRLDLNTILFTWEDPNDLILPIGSDNRISISSIGEHNHTDLPVIVMASSGISPGVYPLIITMEYYDQTGTKQTITSTVGIQVSGTTTFDVVVQTSTGTSTSFAIINTGANTASSVVVSIPPQLSYTTTGSSYSSVGNLEAGDYTLASFAVSSTVSNTTAQFPSFNRTWTGGAPPDRNFSGSRNGFMNQSFPGRTGNQLLVQIAYTDVFGVRQTVQKRVNLTSGSTSGFSSRTRTSSSAGQFPGGFSGSSQSSESNNSLTYITIGVIGIIVVVVLIQLGRKKKLSRLSKYFKGRKE
jgi:hypothetical protein